MQNLNRSEMKHAGIPISSLILERESYDDFLALEAHWFKGYNVNRDHAGVNPMEAMLIETAARADWFLCRAERNYAHVEAELKKQVPDVLLWPDDYHRTLGHFARYRAANAAFLVSACKAVQDFQKARTRELAEAQKLRREAEKTRK